MSAPVVRSLSFRARLALAMMLVVAAVTVATLIVTQRSFEAAYTRVSRDRFAAEADAFASVQEARLAGARTAVLGLARSVRLLAALRERDVDLLYKSAVDELRHVLVPDPDVSALPAASFFRIVTADGTVLAPRDARAGVVDPFGHATWERRIGGAARAAAADRRQHIGYVAPVVGGRRTLDEVIITPIVDRAEDKAIGALAIGFSAYARVDAAPLGDRVASGIWLERRLYSRDIPPMLGHGAAVARLRDALRARLAAKANERATADFDLTLDGRPYRVFHRPLHESSHLPSAYLVGLYSLAQARAQEQRLRATVLRVAALALLLGLVASMLLSRTLSVPIRELVAGTAAVERGDLAVRVPVHRDDEIGRLAASFNEMVEGLALKERYRNVLDVVADKSVAEELLAGAIALGGEVKDVSVLFCDVRGFTALTERMPPEEVIAMLNEHMTALTAIVHEHHGIVDKFVGDALMAIFGAPRAHGDDALDAVNAARRMIAARRSLNAAGGHALEVGIGIASGAVVAGCMGSAQRMNYTVVGERVNLAARLCAHAGRMEVLIDEATSARVAAEIALEPLTAVQLKGFQAPVAVFRVRDAAPLATAS